MRQENYRNKLKVNRITTALLCIFFYILLVLVLKTVQNWITVGSMGMTVFGIIELIAVIIYLSFYTWWSFKNASQETTATFFKYLLLVMIPFFVMVLITIIISSISSNGNFSSNWNAITFYIAPTVFCFIPFGVLYQMMGSMSVFVFFVLCLILMAAFQYVGFILGNGSRNFARDRELVRAEHDKKMMQRQDEMARLAIEKRRQNAIRREATVRKRTVVDDHDPLKDIESTAVVETEAFSMITDDMIKEAIRQKKIKTTEQKVAERISRTVSKQHAVNTKVNQEDVLNQLEKKHTALVEQKKKERIQAAENLQKELALIKERLKKKDNE